MRVPITLQMLKRFPLALRNVSISSFEATLFTTAFVCAFFGFLRVGEIAINAKNADRTKVVQAEDIHISENECHMTIRFSKTDQLGLATTLTFSK